MVAAAASPPTSVKVDAVRPADDERRRADDAGHRRADELQRYARGMERLLLAVQELSLARRFEDVQRVVRTTARALAGSDGATFVLNDGGLYCHYADEDAIEPLWKGRRFPQETCISGWVMRNRQVAVIPDIYADPRIPHEAYRPTFVKSLAMVPIRTLDPVGAIGNYWATSHVPSAVELQLLQALADSTSVAMENLRIYSELEQRVDARTAELIEANGAIRKLSVTDELTGLVNRRGFYDQCETAIPGAARIFVAFLDVDGLKRVNDAHGHAAGDAMLADFAGVLRACFGPADILARLGGDEFCALMLDPTVTAVQVRQTLFDELAAFNADAARPYRLSASLGLVEAEGGDPSMLDRLLHGADGLMYGEKKAKRKER